MNLQFKFISIILILVILVGGGILWWITKQKLPQVEPQVEHLPLIPSKCQSWYNEIEKAFQEANFCERDQDCKAISLEGPYIEFDCYKFVNIAINKDVLLKKVEEYDKECGPAINKCARTPEIICVSNRCIAKE